MLNGVGDIYAVNITHHLRAFKKNFQLSNCVIDFYEEIRTHRTRALTKGCSFKRTKNPSNYYF